MAISRPLFNELSSGSLFIRVSFQQWYKKINKRKGDENRENRKKYFQAEDSSELHAYNTCPGVGPAIYNSKSIQIVNRNMCVVCVLGGRGSWVVPFFLSVNFPITAFNETRVRCVEGATG